MRKTYKFRMYPNKDTEKQLFWTLTRCRELYNAALTERRDAYHFHVRQHPNYYDEPIRKQLAKELTVGYYEQQNALPEIKAELREEYQEIAAHVLQDVLRRLDKAFRNFYRGARTVKIQASPVFRVTIAMIASPTPMGLVGSSPWQNRARKGRSVSRR